MFGLLVVLFMLSPFYIGKIWQYIQSPYEADLISDMSFFYLYRKGINIIFYIIIMIALSVSAFSAIGFGVKGLYSSFTEQTK